MDPSDSKKFQYVGSELDLFSRAYNWKSYWSGAVAPYVGARVLDVGAGIGSTLRVLWTEKQTRWLALEPDPGLAERVAADVAEGRLPRCCEVRIGTIANVAAGEIFDTVLYIDVLEHIADDRQELERASSLLAPGGRIIVLSPSHQWLFTPFDAALGHFRRYSKRTLEAATPPSLRVEAMFYLDTVGLLASLGNKLLLRHAHATAAQIELWDRWMVPLSRRVDPLLGHRTGKSIVGVWTLRA